MGGNGLPRREPKGVARLTYLKPSGLFPSSLKLVYKSEAILEGGSESSVCLFLNDLFCPELLRRLVLFQTNLRPRFPIVLFPRSGGVSDVGTPRSCPARAWGSVCGEMPQLLALWLLWPWGLQGVGLWS